MNLGLPIPWLYIREKVRNGQQLSVLLVNNAPTGRQIALPRLRGLFSTPSPSSVARAPTDPSGLEGSLSTGVSLKQSKKAAKRLKIRVLTWNMHDSLPKVQSNSLSSFFPI